MKSSQNLIAPRHIAALLGLLLLVLSVPGHTEEDRPTIELRVWRVEFPAPAGGDIDWEEAFRELDKGTGASVPSFPRQLPNAGKPLYGPETQVVRQQVVSQPRVVAPPPSSPKSQRQQFSTHAVRHRDPEGMDHLVKQMTGQVSDPSTRDSSLQAARDFRDPVRTVADPQSGRILMTGIAEQRDPPPPVIADPVELPPLPDDFVPRAPISPRITPIGHIPFQTFEGILAHCGTVKQLFARQATCVEGMTVTFELPFVHSRGEQGSFTVGLELRVVPRGLARRAWAVDVQPHILSFEQAPRTIRMVLEQPVTLEPGETLALTHILDPECARAPSMFEKEPPAARTIVFLTRPGR